MVSGTQQISAPPLPDITTPPAANPDLLSQIGQIINQSIPIVNNISNMLNPAAAPSGSSTTGSTGGGIPIAVNLSPATTSTINSLQGTIGNAEVIIFVIALVLLAVWILA